MNSEDFVKDAKLKLRPANDKTRIISETATDEKGRFQFEDIEQGKYILIASGKKLKTLYIPLKVSNRQTDSKLQISLGVLVGVPCGGDVSLTKLMPAQQSFGKIETEKIKIVEAPDNEQIKDNHNRKTVIFYPRQAEKNPEIQSTRCRPRDN